MKYVLDSNVALKWVLPEPDAAKAVQIRDEFRRGVHALHSPDIYPIEVAHSLARAERRRIILPSEGWPKLVDVLTTPPDFHALSSPSAPSIRTRLKGPDRSLRLSLRGLGRVRGVRAAHGR